MTSIHDEGITSSSSSLKTSRLQGMKIRDEFLCPITYELLREPVVASDGHTYEKAAIEKWLRSNRTSPRSGQSMDDSLVKNTNMKKLIQDMIDEGGKGLYTNDAFDRERLFDVFAEKVIVLKCLGPPESDWNMQSFQVSHLGCIGGRKIHSEEANPTGQKRDVMLFKDTTVSRKHFEIAPVSNNLGKYAIRDLGSAGGTFIRIQAGQKKQLHAGMMLLLGKHQFIVSSIDDTGSTSGQSSSKSQEAADFDNDYPDHPNGSSANVNDSVTSDTNLALAELISHTEQLVADLSCTDSNVESQYELEKRLREFNLKVRESFKNGSSGDRRRSISSANEEKEYANSKDSRDGDEKIEAEEKAGSRRSGTESKNRRNNEDESDSESIGNTVDNRTRFKDEAKERELSMKDSEKTPRNDDERKINHTGNERKINHTGKRCTITCFNPDGSPLQGRSFIVSSLGASLGRKVTNDIVLSHSAHCPLDLIPATTGKENFLNIDTAISAEHARIQMDMTTGCFYIVDGNETKPSTNGTWFRLSGPQQESPFFVIEPKIELLIGIVLRFEATEGMTISEHTVDQAVLSNKVISDISIDISGCDNLSDKENKRTQRYNDIWDEKEGEIKDGDSSEGIDGNRGAIHHSGSISNALPGRGDDDELITDPK